MPIKTVGAAHNMLIDSLSIFSKTARGSTFLKQTCVAPAAVTIHKAQGSQWDIVQVFAPDIFVAARMGRVEAGQPLWKRLAYVAITRAAQELRWVVANRLARPTQPLSVEDLKAPAALELAGEE